MPDIPTVTVTLQDRTSEPVRLSQNVTDMRIIRNLQIVPAAEIRHPYATMKKSPTRHRQIPPHDAGGHLHRRVGFSCKQPCPTNPSSGLSASFSPALGRQGTCRSHVFKVWNKNRINQLTQKTTFAQPSPALLQDLCGGTRGLHGVLRCGKPLLHKKARHLSMPGL